MCSAGGQRRKLTGRGRERRGLGFTLIETVIAVALLMVVVAGTFSAVTFAYSASAASEGLNTAKNVAGFVAEALRARTQTQQNVLGDANDALPGLHDLCGDSLDINSSAVAPDEDSAQLLGQATYSCLQGVVSLRASPPDHTVDCEDPNLKIHNFSGTWKYADYTKPDAHTDRWQPVVVQFPVIAGDSTYTGITLTQQFSAQNPSAYAALVHRIYNPSAQVDPHFTQDAGEKEACTAYRGHRVFMKLTARSANVSKGSSGSVQYYDVVITVYWRTGNAERSYETTTRILVF